MGFLLHKPYPYTAYIGFSDSSIWDGEMFDPNSERRLRLRFYAHEGLEKLPALRGQPPETSGDRICWIPEFLTVF